MGDIRKLGEIVKEFKVTDTLLVPTAISILLNDPDFDRQLFSSLQTILYTGSPMPPELLRRAKATLGDVFIQSYGSTETFVVSILIKEDQKNVTDTIIGRPCPGVSVRIESENGIELRVGEIGEICVKSDSVMAGFYGSAEVDRKIGRSEWYSMGDLGFLDENGYLNILGRKDCMIITGGLNVSPAEVEMAILKHPAVKEVSVFGSSDPKWGSSITAVVVLQEGQDISQEELIKYCGSHIATYKKPKCVYFVDELPKTASGKIAINELKTKYNNSRISKGSNYSYTYKKDTKL
jgi:acyl-CoA synthetase (AMP-forming)/AMP-acid ligase II